MTRVILKRLTKLLGYNWVLILQMITVYVRYEITLNTINNTVVIINDYPKIRSLK